MFKKFIIMFVVLDTMMLLGILMSMNKGANVLPDPPVLEGEVIYDDYVEDGRMAMKITKVTEDSYRVQIVYTRKGRDEMISSGPGEILGMQTDIALNREAIEELISEMDIDVDL